MITTNFLWDKNLSLKAKGLMCYFVFGSYEGDIESDIKSNNYSTSELAKECKESVTAIRTAVNELKKYGYLEVTKTKDSNGRFVYEYKLYDKEV